MAIDLIKYTTPMSMFWLPRVPLPAGTFSFFVIGRDAHHPRGWIIPPSRIPAQTTKKVPCVNNATMHLLTFSIFHPSF